MLCYVMLYYIISYHITSKSSLRGEGLVPCRPVQVAIGDAEVFAEIFGREEQGGWLGIGPKPLKPAALIGQERVRALKRSPLHMSHHE